VFQIEVTGLESSKAMLQSLEKIAKVKRAVDLVAFNRHDPWSKGMDNAQVLRSLASGGRDFTPPSKKALEKMDSAALEIIEKGLKKYEVTATKTKIVFKNKMTDVKARQVLSSALMNVAKEWKREITRRIREADWVGGGSTTLVDWYAAWKQKEFGFVYPIGKATEQLLENVKPDRKNLKLRNG
jgi:hypothetical protein